MCLICNNDSKIVVADKDIVCYKVLRVTSRKRITSLFQQFRYKVGKTYKTGTILKKIHEDGEDVVKKGFHSFPYLRDAIKLKDMNSLRVSNYKVYKCVIPKGTKIIYGKYFIWPSIVSEAIKVVGGL